MTSASASSGTPRRSVCRFLTPRQVGSRCRWLWIDRSEHALGRAYARSLRPQAEPVRPRRSRGVQFAPGDQAIPSDPQCRRKQLQRLRRTVLDARDRAAVESGRAFEEAADHRILICSRIPGPRRWHSPHRDCSRVGLRLPASASCRASVSPCLQCTESSSCSPPQPGPSKDPAARSRRPMVRDGAACLLTMTLCVWQAVGSIALNS